MMKKICLFISVVSCFLLSCGTFTFNDTKGAKLVASIGKEKLYVRDVVGLNAPDLTEDDSVEIIENYAQYWLKTRAVEQYSKKRYAPREEEIEKLMEEYRSSLFLEFFENEYIRGVSDFVSDEEIEKYYKDNKQKFVLSSNMVKAAILTIPKAYKDAALMKKKFASSKRDDFEDIVSIAERDNLIVKDFSNSWVYFSDVVGLVPFTGDATQFIKGGDIFEITDDNFRYSLKIIEYKLVGDVTPKELVEDLIKRAIVVERRKTRLQDVRDSIFSVAVVGGEAVIKYDE